MPSALANNVIIEFLNNNSNGDEFIGVSINCGEIASFDSTVQMSHLDARPAIIGAAQFHQRKINMPNNLSSYHLEAIDCPPSNRIAPGLSII